MKGQHPRRHHRKNLQRIRINAGLFHHALQQEAVQHYHYTHKSHFDLYENHWYRHHRHNPHKLLKAIQKRALKHHNRPNQHPHKFHHRFAVYMVHQSRKDRYHLNHRRKILLIHRELKTRYNFDDRILLHHP